MGGDGCSGKGLELNGSLKLRGKPVLISSIYNSVKLQANDNDGEASAVPILIEDLYNWEPYADNPHISVPKEVAFY